MCVCVCVCVCVYVCVCVNELCVCFVIIVAWRGGKGFHKKLVCLADVVVRGREGREDGRAQRKKKSERKQKEELFDAGVRV